MFRLLLWVMFIVGHGHTFYYNYKLMPFITPGTFILHHGLTVVSLTPPSVVRYYKCYIIITIYYIEVKISTLLSKSQNCKRPRMIIKL